jgi:hypothetical protein
MVTYKTFYDMPCVAVDGPMASGKMLTAQLVHHLFETEQWVNPLMTEHIAAANIMRAIGDEDASNMIRIDIDTLQDELKIGRRLNTKLGESSSVLSSPDVGFYLAKMLARRTVNCEVRPMILMLHGVFECYHILHKAMTSESATIFQFRSPMSLSLLRHYILWIERWEKNTRTFQPRFSITDEFDEVHDLVFYFWNISEARSNWIHLNRMEKAILLVSHQIARQLEVARQAETDNVYDITPVFFESMCTSPRTVIDLLVERLSRNLARRDLAMSRLRRNLLLHNNKVPRVNPEQPLTYAKNGNISVRWAEYYEIQRGEFKTYCERHVRSGLMQNMLQLSIDYEKAHARFLKNLAVN